jgi:hypothetical protein
MKDVTAKKRTKGAVNRILAAHKTLRQQLLKLKQEDRDFALKTLVDQTAETVKFVNAQAATPMKFDFPETE